MPAIRRQVAAGVPPREIERALNIAPRSLRSLIERIRRESAAADRPIRIPARLADPAAA